jgi:hypothetical protein
MRKIVRLTENDLSRLVRKIINEAVIAEETNLSSSVKKFELFTDPNLTKSIGTYLFVESDIAMGGNVTIYVKPTSNSKFKCLKLFSYRTPRVKIFSGQITLSTMDNTGCSVPKVLYTNDYGEDILKSY